MHDPSRTEPATPKRRSEAREKGQVARSREIPAAAVLLGGFAAIYFSAGSMLDGFSGILRDLFTASPARLDTVNGMHTLLLDVFVRGAWLLLPVFAATVVCAASGNLAQTGWLVTTYPLAPKFEKLNPVAGFERLFSLQSLAELAKSVLKFSIIAFFAYRIIRREIPVLPEIVERTPQEIVVYMLRMCGEILLKCGVVLAVLAAADYAFQWWSFERGLRMTKEEVKEEWRAQEGDPQVKARIRSIQREKARRRIFQEVPKADVVITNPTHYAVALRYDRAGMGAPMVVAKGVDVLARRIRELAEEHGVPVVARPPLARALHDNVDEGQEIPFEFYKAVAEVLAYVYRLRDRKFAG